jgi:hypothetical protein
MKTLRKKDMKYVPFDDLQLKYNLLDDFLEKLHFLDKSAAEASHPASIRCHRSGPVYYQFPDGGGDCIEPARGSCSHQNNRKKDAP